MAKLLTSLTLVCLLFLPHRTDYSQSIKTLAWSTQPVVNVGPFSVQDDDAEPVVKGHCTTWAYEDLSGTHWITAAHCVTDEETGALEDHDYQINGKMAWVETFDLQADLASLRSYTAPGLPIATVAPALESTVKIRGFIFANPSALVTAQGIISAENFVFTGEELPYTVMQLPICPGNSGSPIFDSHDKVVGVGQAAPMPYCSPYTASLPFSELQHFLSEL